MFGGWGWRVETPTSTDVAEGRRSRIRELEEWIECLGGLTIDEQRELDALRLEEEHDAE